MRLQPPASPQALSPALPHHPSRPTAEYLFPILTPYSPLLSLAMAVPDRAAGAGGSVTRSWHCHEEVLGMTLGQRSPGQEG